MPRPFSITSSCLSKLFLIFFFVLISHGDFSATQLDHNNRKTMKIGAIINTNSRMGREEKVAMEIGIQDFNNGWSNNYKLVLHVRNSSGDPLEAAAAADNLIKDKQVQVIIGMETWQEAAFVAQVGNQAQVPVISFATAAITPSLASVRWPFLVRMANNASLQMSCVAKIVGSNRWRRVIVVYEDDTYGGDSGIVTLLSDSLRDVGSEIEYSLVLPSFSSLSDPKTEIRGELKKIQSKKSRVFVVLHSSMQLATHLFAEAKEMDLMGNDTVWIATDSIANHLDNANSSVMTSMEGFIGIKSYFSEISSAFQDFSFKFRKNYRSDYRDEEKYEPGIYAVRAYDAISSVVRAADRSTYISASKTLLQNILSSNFRGLSGEIGFEDGELSQNPIYRIVNVIDKGYRELKLWSMELGYFEGKNGGEKGGDGGVNWPGGLTERAPLGWVMPSASKPLLIALPRNPSLEEIVKVKEGEEGLATGFGVEVFKTAVELLSYNLPYVFKAVNGTYDELVAKIYREEYDAVVGDVTILANRTKYVDFTRPYAGTRLSMIIPLKLEESQKPSMFMKPFTKTMWLMTGAILVYTMFIVWFLEHRINSEFSGTWRNQLGTTLWFTLSTLFSTQREKLRNNLTRVVIVVWLFVVFIVTSSYTASLTSILTVQRLEPTATDIDSLRRSNSKVACNGDSFVGHYLEKVLNFDRNNIINITGNNYTQEFENGRIVAALLELPAIQSMYLSQYCEGYQISPTSYRFGGLGFVFPKGSPFATDISEAILKLSENGTMTQLEKNLLKSSAHCSSLSDNTLMNSNNQSLSLRNFWGLFLLTGATSTIVFLLYILSLFKKFRRHREAYDGSTSPNDDRLWNQTKRFKDYFYKGSFTASAEAVNVADQEWNPVSEEHVSEYYTPGLPQASSPAEIEIMPDTYTIVPLDTNARDLNLASFPGWDRRLYGTAASSLGLSRAASTPI